MPGGVSISRVTMIAIQQATIHKVQGNPVCHNTLSITNAAEYRRSHCLEHFFLYLLHLCMKKNCYSLAILKPLIIEKAGKLEARDE